MTHKSFFSLAIAGWVLMICPAVGAHEDPSAKAAFEEGREAYEAAGTAAEKLAIVNDFLKRFPDTEYTDFVLGLGVDLLTDDLEDPDRAEQLLHTVVEKVESAEVKKKVLFRLAALYGKTGKTDEFVASADDLVKNHDLKFVDLNELNKKAIQYDAWDLALRISEAAMPLASAAQYRADYPDMVMTDEELERRGRRRIGLTLAQKGWAQVRLSETDEGIETLERAIEYSGFNYVGIPDTDAQKYLGMALVSQNEYDKAIALLTADAIYGGSEDALESLKKAYVRRNAGEEGFDDFKWKLRLDNARKVDSFALKDYRDQTFDFAVLKGEVVLLSFWNPT